MIPKIKKHKILTAVAICCVALYGVRMLMTTMAATESALVFEVESGSVAGKTSIISEVGVSESFVRMNHVESSQTSYPLPGEVGFMGDLNSLQNIQPNSGKVYSVSGSATLSGVRIASPIYWDGQGGTLTMRDCIVDAGPSPTGAIFAASGGTLDIDRCTIKNGVVNSSGILHGGSKKIIKNSELSGGADGVNGANPGSIFEHNVIKDLGSTSLCNEVHNDGFQIYGSTDVTIKNNYISLNFDSCNTNGGVFTQGGSSSQHVVVDGNYFDGAAFALVIQSGSAKVVNNIFTKRQLFGACSLQGGSISEWVNNRWSDGSEISGC